MLERYSNGRSIKDRALGKPEIVSSLIQGGVAGGVIFLLNLFVHSSLNPVSMGSIVAGVGYAHKVFLPNA